MDFVAVPRARSRAKLKTCCHGARCDLGTTTPLEVLGFDFMSGLSWGPRLTSLESSPRETTGPLVLLSCRNGDTVDFCLGLVTEVFKLSQKHTDAGNFQANRKTAKETKLCASMGDHTDPQEARPTSSFLQNHQQSGTANFIINWESVSS